MTQLVKQLTKDFPGIKFTAGKRFAWSPSNETITYYLDGISNNQGKLALLHELSHAQLDHTKFTSDLELLGYEVAAWQNARKLAEKYAVTIDEDYIEDCLESYRDWVYKRSTCVECSTNSFQDNSGHYICHICGSRWSVPKSQLCRVQRRKI